MDSRLLGVLYRRILLDAGSVGGGAIYRRALDASMVGLSQAETISGTRVTGDRMSDSMAVSITASVIPAEAFTAGIGKATCSTITAA